MRGVRNDKKIVASVKKWFVVNTALDAGGAMVILRMMTIFIAMIVVMRLELICVIITRTLCNNR